MIQPEHAISPNEKIPVLALENFTEATIEAFISSSHISTVSARAYRNAIKQMLNFFAANQITTPSEFYLDAYINSLRADGKSVPTLRLYSSVIKLFFSFLERHGICRNYAAELSMRLRKSATHSKKALTLSQARSLISAVGDNNVLALRNKSIISLALQAGLRTIEIERADVRDLRHASDCWFLDVQSKGHLSKDDTVKIAPPVAKSILDYLDARAVFSPDSPLFVSTSRNRSKYGDRLSAQSIGKMIKSYMKSIGINDSKITAHSCRHFAATTAIKAGCDIREVSAMLRHSNVNITMTYLHDINLENRRAELAVADSLFGNSSLN